MKSIEQTEFFNSTSRGGSSPVEVAIQVIFDQHFTVDIELTSGTVYKKKYIRPVPGKEFCWVSDQHNSGSESVVGTILVNNLAIVAIHFSNDREYLITENK